MFSRISSSEHPGMTALTNTFNTEHYSGIRCSVVDVGSPGQAAVVNLDAMADTSSDDDADDVICGADVTGDDVRCNDVSTVQRNFISSSLNEIQESHSNGIMSKPDLDGENSIIKQQNEFNTNEEADRNENNKIQDGLDRTNNIRLISNVDGENKQRLGSQGEDILETNSPPKFLKQPKDLDILEGDPAVFECELSPRLDSSSSSVTWLEWFKDDDAIPPDDDDFQQTFDGRVARLSITDTYVDDSAVYRCVARNEAGQDDVTARLLVNEAASSSEDEDEIVTKDENRKTLEHQTKSSDTSPETAIGCSKDSRTTVSKVNNTNNNTKNNTNNNTDIKINTDNNPDTTKGNNQDTKANNTDNNTNNNPETKRNNPDNKITSDNNPDTKGNNTDTNVNNISPPARRSIMDLLTNEPVASKTGKHFHSKGTGRISNNSQSYARNAVSTLVTSTDGQLEEKQRAPVVSLRGPPVFKSRLSDKSVAEGSPAFIQCEICTEPSKNLCVNRNSNAISESDSYAVCSRSSNKISNISSVSVSSPTRDVREITELDEKSQPSRKGSFHSTPGSNVTNNILESNAFEAISLRTSTSVTAAATPVLSTVISSTSATYGAPTTSAASTTSGTITTASTETSKTSTTPSAGTSRTASASTSAETSTVASASAGTARKAARTAASDTTEKIANTGARGVSVLADEASAASSPSTSERSAWVGSTGVALADTVVEDEVLVMWYKDSELLRSGSLYRLTFDGKVATLGIKEVFPSDAGVYECVVRNSHGKDSTICRLIVEQTQPQNTQDHEHIEEEDAVSKTYWGGETNGRAWTHELSARSVSSPQALSGHPRSPFAFLTRATSSDSFSHIDKLTHRRTSEDVGIGRDTSKETARINQVNQPENIAGSFTGQTSVETGNSQSNKIVLQQLQHPQMIQEREQVSKDILDLNYMSDEELQQMLNTNIDQDLKEAVRKRRREIREQKLAALEKRRRSEDQSREDPLQRRLRQAEEEKQRKLEEYQRSAGAHLRSKVEQATPPGKGAESKHQTGGRVAEERTNSTEKSTKVPEKTSTDITVAKDINENRVKVNHSDDRLDSRDFMRDSGRLTHGDSVTNETKVIRPRESEVAQRCEVNGARHVQRQTSLANIGKSVSVDDDNRLLTTSVRRSNSSGSALKSRGKNPAAGGPQRGMDRLISQLDSSPSSPRVQPSASPRVVTVQRSNTTIKQKLLDWCQAVVKGYQNVEITNFTTSWSDGLAFCALIHYYYPQAFDYSQLSPRDQRHNLQLAFDTAERYAGIDPLLEVDDMIRMEKPDWKCVFTYVQNIYRILTLPRRVIPPRHQAGLPNLRE